MKSKTFVFIHGMYLTPLCKEFAGRTHVIIGQEGWEEVADYILAWLNEKGA